MKISFYESKDEAKEKSIFDGIVCVLFLGFFFWVAFTSCSSQEQELKNRWDGSVVISAKMWYPGAFDVSAGQLLCSVGMIDADGKFWNRRHWVTPAYGGIWDRADERQMRRVCLYIVDVQNGDVDRVRAHF